ncbi:UbiX family flavin prenyltransferase [Caproicibacter fermentans]|uniref:Flavin prenyltransferase UbiX n=1 Tax=Caproicibacter fermentans TaxID=2576756 RepID=A0A7G8TDP1_9FIRM|nr:UbiX family flavin prenyltransferase [Caproicibacter fermentans]QNK41732.1 UbiX family flavin prenyltransferase [Caproicibacter fermentans]
MKKLIIGLTGASGSAYFLRLVDALSHRELELHLVATEHGTQILEYETGVRLEERLVLWRQGPAKIIEEDNQNLFSPVASGSFQCDGMLILPCSMSAAAQISAGISETLLTRAADVMIKEKRPLVLVPRETPLSPVHLKNLYRLSKLGVTILPAMPGFYNRPQSVDDLIDFVAGKAMDSLGLQNDYYRRWEGKEKNEEKD